MATSYTLNLKNPTAYEPAGDAGLGNLLNNVINGITIAAGVLLFLYLVYGGLMFMTASGDEKAVTKAKAIMTNAGIGVIVIVCAYFIVQIFGRILGFPNIFDLSFPGPTP